ncbi:hypothetical protein [Anaeromicropila populeti]|uniref:Lipoprotein n=1 Tax=Anaeromicropila populeti TaxID=37658 RepID=A0A1I6LKN8_9FIRM|nr:hypothetical protein [Anaeromicropila populeti]SFS04054.1 hypothetical protein SAMN05661086_03369 [Anaeromicropila populeti]
MKRKLILCILCLSMCVSVSCGTKNNAVADNPVASVTIEPLPEPSVSDNMDNEKQAPYVGEYNDFDFDEPNLEIEKNEDGSYEIEIGIYRITTFQNCKGILVDDKIEFSTEFSDRKIEGTIELNGDIATVTFTSKDWAEYSNIDTYLYKKSSDKPFDKHEKFVF